MLFLTIHEGDLPSNTEPIFATQDREIIDLVMIELNKRMGFIRDKSYRKNHNTTDHRLQPRKLKLKVSGEQP